MLGRVVEGAEPPLYYFRQIDVAALERELPSLHRAIDPLPEFLTGSRGYAQTSWQVVIGPSGSGASEQSVSGSRSYDLWVVLTCLLPRNPDVDGLRPHIAASTTTR